VTTGTPAPYCEVKGGLCGSANINYGQASTCPPVVDGTLPGATTDMGHQGQNDGSWALDDPQAQIDFASAVDGELGCRPAKTWLTALGSGA
jgi:hypothetical protein